MRGATVPHGRQHEQRVTAPATPPADTPVQHTEFRGPLYEAWGERMRRPALAERLAGARSHLGIPGIADRDAWAHADPVAVAETLREADDEFRTPWPQARASSYARFVRDGDRDEFQDAVFARQHRLTRAVVAAAATDEQRWIDEAADGAVLLCEQSSWAWPAHDDAHAKRGFSLPDCEHPYLDLGAGEIVAQLAVAHHVLGARWAASWPGLRERIEHEAEARVFLPFETRDDFWWLGYWRSVNNWNPWILGNVLLAAVLLLDDTDRLARLFDRALESLDRYVAELPADGAIDEGVAYWWNGAARMLECLDLAERATGGALSGASVPVVTETLRYPLRLQLGGRWYVNVADAPATSSGDEPWDVAFRWGDRLADDEVRAWASGSRVAGAPAARARSGLPRMLRAVMDHEWCSADARPAPLPAAVWLPSAQLMVCRAQAGRADGLTVAAKGGTNDENHNHKDVGSFIVAAGGMPLVVDIGKPTYTAQTFGPERYGIRAVQSSWHSTAAPFGLEQGAGPGFRARVVRTPFGATGDATHETGSVALPAELELELGGAYPLAVTDSWRRTIRLASPSRVEIVDEWALSAAPDGAEDAPGLVHLVLAGDVRLTDGRVVAERADRAVAITTSEGVPPVLESWELDDAELTAVWGARLTRLTYAVPSSHGCLTTVIEENA